MQHVKNMIGAVSTPCRSCFFCWILRGDFPILLEIYTCLWVLLTPSC